MGGGGLVQLIAYGTQNLQLSGNPNMTFFYKTFKKYTHYSSETTSKLMDGITDYPYDQPIQIRARIDRVGDLVSDMYFSFDLPAIYSKYRTPDTDSTHQYEFQWVRNIAAAAIQSVSISVGPNKIQEFTGEYLMAKAMIDYPKEKFEKWRRMVGDVPELYDPANGIYGSPSVTSRNGEYPTVFPDPDVTIQANNPSIPSYTVTVPLPFWFTQDNGCSALPLVALQYYTVDVVITLRPSNKLYTTLDSNGTRMAPGFSKSTGNTPNTPIFNTVSDTQIQLRNFFTDIGFQPPMLNIWTFNPTIHTTYIFLPESEQKIFATTPLTYITRQVTHLSFPEIINNNSQILDIHNPISRILILPRRSDSIFYRNNLTNFTNWWDYPLRPYIPITNERNFVSQFGSGTIVPSGQLDILQSIQIVADGNEIQEAKPLSFYTDLTHFRGLSGSANTKIPVFSFELFSPTSQPSGSLNASRIRKFQLDMKVNPLPADTNYVYSIDVYVESLNFFLVESGMGDNKYTL